MRKIVAVLLLLSLGSIVYAQKNEQIQQIKNVRGEYAVVLELSDVTGREAMLLAYEDAKRKALEKAFGSRVSIWEQMEISSGGDSFNSMGINQIDGEIVEFKILSEGHRQSEARASETIFYCVADVKVKKGIDPDPNFVVDVNGLQSVYYSGQELLFSVHPHLNCHMKIFLFEDQYTAYLLYPNDYDRNSLLAAHQEWNISDSPYYSFVLNKAPDKPKEINRLVFVFTKTERPFNEAVTSRTEIEKWIAIIPNDQKFLYFSVFEIRDR